MTSRTDSDDIWIWSDNALKGAALTMIGLIRRVLAALLTVVGLALVGTAFWNYPGRTEAELASPTPAATQRPSDAPRADTLPGVTSPSSAVPDGAIATLTIPRLGIKDAAVFDRGIDDHGNMQIAQGYAVTHFAFSARLGTGNSVLYGHDDIEGSVFARLQELLPGDEVHVSTPNAAARIYRVTDRKVVAPTAVEILNPTGDIRLTIFTCWPTFVDNQRVVITARPVS